MILAISLWVALSQAPTAPPPVRDPLLRRGAALFDTLDFENARAAYERALSVRLASPDEVAEAYLGVGLCDATLGDDVKAKQSFLKALAVKPDSKLEGADISPRQRAPFDAARAEARGRPAIRVEHVAPPSWPPGAVVTLRVGVESDWLGLVAGARAAFRREGQTEWEEVAVTGAPPFAVLLPPMGAGVVEYWVQAIDGRGSPIAQWRSAASAMRMKVAEPGSADDATPLYKRPWVWAVVGGVVAAGVTAGVVAGVTATPDYQVRTRPAP